MKKITNTDDSSDTIKYCKIILKSMHRTRGKSLLLECKTSALLRIVNGIKLIGQQKENMNFLVPKKITSVIDVCETYMKDGGVYFIRLKKNFKVDKWLVTEVYK